MVMYAGQEVEAQPADAAVRAAASSLYRGAAGGAAGAQPGQAPPRHHSRRRARHRRPARRLRVQSALRLRAPSAAGAKRPLLAGKHGAAVRCHYPLIGGQPRDHPGMAATKAAAVMSANVLRGARTCTATTRSRPRLPARCPRRCRRWPAPASTLAAGKTLAVVGESGCGKSTLAPHDHHDRAADQRQAADRRHRRRSAPAAETLRGLRAKVQMVFQNPYGSLNPRKQVGQILEEPLEINTPMKSAERAHAIAQRDDGARSACGRSTTAAIRTCSPAASASASPSPAR